MQNWLSVFNISEWSDDLLDKWPCHEIDKKKIKKKKKRGKNWIFYWVTGPLASLSIQCSRQKVRNLDWLVIWLSLAL